MSEALIIDEPIVQTPAPWELSSEQQKAPADDASIVDHWLFYLSNVESPRLYKLWGLYFLISSCLQRRVWCGGLGKDSVFPNLYVIFSGIPSTGKSRIISAIEAAVTALPVTKDASGKEIYSSHAEISTGADSTSLEKLTKRLAENPRVVKYKEQVGDKQVLRIYSHCSMAFMLDELATLFRKKSPNETADLITFFNKCWDCKDYKRETKTAGDDIIKNVFLSFLAGTQPKHIREMHSTGLFESGFAARLIIVHELEPEFRKLSMRVSSQQTTSLQKVLAHLRKLTVVFGIMAIEEDAYAHLEAWYKDAMGPKLRLLPTVLQDYAGRKLLHVTKLSMILHFLTSIELKISIEDIKSAISILETTEKNMADAFSLEHALSTEGAQVIDMLNYITALGHPAKTAEIIVHFLRPVGSKDKILSYIETLQASGKIKATTYQGKAAYEPTSSS